MKAKIEKRVRDLERCRCDAGLKCGSIMIVVLVLVFFISALVLSYFVFIRSESQEIQLDSDLAKSRYLAEGATNVVLKDVLIGLGKGAGASGSGQVVVTGYKVDYLVRDLSETNPGLRFMVTDSDGIRSYITTYEIIATADFNNVKATVHRQIQTIQMPLFQFAVFDKGDLEIHADNPMQLTGRLHANGGMYFGGDAGDLLDIDSKHVFAGSGIYKKTLEDGAPTTGQIKINNRNLSFDSDDPDWDAKSRQNWGDDVKDDANKFNVPELGSIKLYVPTESGTGGDYAKDPVTGEIVKLPPEQSGTGAYEKGFYHSEAELIIIDDKAFVPDPANPGELKDITAQVIGPNPQTSLFVEKEFFDKNHGKVVKVTEISMTKLRTSGYWPANGLLYIARTDCTAEQPNGVRLADGATLDGALTVVSPNPVYLLGHYNQANKKPAALICDSVNFLSVSWQDHHLDRGLEDLTVGGTARYNLAIVAGKTKTTPGNYGGGLENLGKFQEDWKGVHKSWITGSLVSLGESEFGAPWNPDNYVSPERQWEYDTDFDDFSKLPPYTPMIVKQGASVITFERGGKTVQDIISQQGG